MAKYRESAAEQTRLESGNPYPSAANVRKMKTYLDNYKATLDKLKAELKTRMLTEAPLAPNEFQTRLRQAIIQTAENARNNRVKLPANFFLGFDEFVSSLPSPEEAPALGQRLLARTRVRRRSRNRGGRYSQRTCAGVADGSNL